MNFEYHNPTHLIFDSGTLSRLGEVASQQGRRALLVTGGGSVKRSGIFERAVKSLQDAGVAVFECDGVEPNPRITSVKRGAAIARENACDLVIALGGGSVMDAAKVMAAAVFYAGDPWDMILHGQPEPYVPTQALPLIAVPTLAATGSEMNCGAVISNEETKEKSFIQNECLYPKVALLDLLGDAAQLTYRTNSPLSGGYRLGDQHDKEYRDYADAQYGLLPVRASQRIF